jgi:hypothetical protein
VVEAFPVGRRLAFDAAKGRLWVVCPRCERWNLTPLEERWEAIEQCERLFRDTRLRQSTDNVGLAQPREGLELVRIGRPQRPELAAWRYGDQFGRRRRNHLLVLAGMGVAATGAVVVGPVMGLVGLPMMYTAYSLGAQVRARYEARHGVHVPLEDGRTVALKRTQLGYASLVGGLTGDPGGEWQLQLPATALAMPAADLLAGLKSGEIAPSISLTGAAAVRAAAAIMPMVNRGGGSRGVVEQAVGLLEDTPAPEALFARIAGAGESMDDFFRRPIMRLGPRPAVPMPPDMRITVMRHMPVGVRLALEMSLHEEQERRALDGELAELERAWQDAEAIAAIADGLLLPASVDTALARLRARAGDGTKSP